METFSALLALCAGNSPVTGEFPSQRPVTRSSDIFFDLRLNKQLGKQSWGLRPLWRLYNVIVEFCFGAGVGVGGAWKPTYARLKPNTAM